MGGERPTEFKAGEGTQPGQVVVNRDLNRLMISLNLADYVFAIPGAERGGTTGLLPFPDRVIGPYERKQSNKGARQRGAVRFLAFSPEA